MSSYTEEEPVTDLNILLNDLKLCKMENNIEEAVESIIYYLSSDQARQEMEFHRRSRKGDKVMIEELDLLINHFIIEVILTRDYETLEQFLDQEPFNEAESRATTLVNFGSYYSIIHEDLEALNCFEEAIEMLNSFVQYKDSSESNTPGSRSEDGYVDTEQNILNIMSLAIAHNNKASVCMKKGEFQRAYEICKKCVSLIEPIVFAKIKSNNSKKLQEDESLSEKVQVLLIILLNLATSAIKIDNIKYAKVVLNHGRKMAKRVLGESTLFEDKFKEKIHKHFNKKGHNRFTKSTHISYIEKEVDAPVFEHGQKNPNGNISSLTKRSATHNEEAKIFSRNSNYKAYQSNKINKRSSKGFGNTSMTVINKSNKRKIFVDRDDNKDNSSNISDPIAAKEDSKQINEDMLNTALERIKKETEEKYEEKLKKMVQDIAKEHQSTLESSKLKQIELEKKLTAEKQKMDQKWEEMQKKQRQIFEEEKLKNMTELDKRNKEEIQRVNTLMMENNKKINMEQEKYNKLNTELKKEIDQIRKEKEELEKELKQQKHQINESLDRVKANDDFTGKIEEEEAKLKNYEQKQEKDTSKSNDMTSPMEHNRKKELSEVEIPLDFEMDKSPPVEGMGTKLDRVREMHEADETLEDEQTGGEEMNKIWDMLDYQNSLSQYKAYQILSIDDNKDIIIGLKLILNQDDEPCIRLTCFDQQNGDPNHPEEHTIYVAAIRAVLLLISYKDVVPNDKPLKLVRNFREYVRLFIFSFIQYDPDIDKDEDGPMQIKCSTLGLLKEEVQIKFCKMKCSIVLKYIQNRTFRLSFYIVGDSEGVFDHGLCIELSFDAISYKSFFTENDINATVNKYPQLDKNLFVKSHKLVDGRDLLKKLEPSIKALDEYGKVTYPSELNSFLYGEEKTNIINQIRILQKEDLDDHDIDHDSNHTIQQLWIVKDDPKNERWEFICKPMYELQLKDGKKKVSVTKIFTYESLWKIFGVDIASCEPEDIQMFANMVLESIVFDITDLNQVPNQPKTEGPEEVKMKLNIICHQRHVVDIEKFKMPMSISLIGNQENYFGIKAVVYNRRNRREEGVFFRINGILFLKLDYEWELPQAEIDALSKAKKKDPLKYFYSLPKYLEEKGFEYIYKNLRFDPDKVPFFENRSGDFVHIDTFEKD
ncbi:unnamed protein product [Moneuplotes crassus]|uniref:Uncharacterized protein n=1 Tax=Euplotes crassus TaxID=5936 RepID=A0AAD1UQ60_EUPCR|nr:unnamed protein product [Moneuplotes crassus]